MRTAFTLIELAVTLVLVGLLSTIVSVSLVQARRAVQMQDVIEQIEHLDHLAREQARRFGTPLKLQVKLNAGTIKSIRASGVEETGPRLLLPLGFEIQRVWTPTADISQGEIELPCSNQGRTSSYALLLCGPSGERQWLLIAGLSGKLERIHDETELQKILTRLAEKRAELD